MDFIMTFMTFCIHSENVYLLILKNIPCYLQNHLLIHNNREKGNQSLSSSFFCSFRDLYWVASINKTFSGRTAEIMFEKYKVPALFLAKNAVCSLFTPFFMMLSLRPFVLCCFVVHVLIDWSFSDSLKSFNEIWMLGSHVICIRSCYITCCWQVSDDPILDMLIVLLIWPLHIVFLKLGGLRLD